MLKICPRCRRTFSGGRDCPRCGAGYPLLDVAQLQTRRTLLRKDSELRGAIRTYYGARSAMLLAFFGILVGLVFAGALTQKAFITPSPARWGWAAAALMAFALPFALSVVGGNWIVRRFALHCIGRPLDLKDVRVVRSVQAEPPAPETGTRGTASPA